MDDESRGRLDVRGEHHLGDMVNIIQHGSLVMHQATSGAAAMSNAGGSSSTTMSTKALSRRGCRKLQVFVSLKELSEARPRSKIGALTLLVRFVC